MDNTAFPTRRRKLEDARVDQSPPQLQKEPPPSQSSTVESMHREKGSTSGIPKASSKDCGEDTALHRSRWQRTVHDVEDLATACLSDNKDEVKRLLGIGVNVNRQFSGQSYGSVLAAAASRGHIEIVRLLLEAGADVNQQHTHARYGNALAAAAASRDNTEIVKLLLKAGADINQQLTAGFYGSALASAASSRGNTEIVELLLAAGADVNQQLTAGFYGSALATAVSGHNAEIVKLLLKAGADINQQLTAGFYGSALAAAVSEHNAEIVKLLLEAGADVNQQLTAGNYGSALAAAASCDIPGIVKLLLEAGADVNQQLTAGNYGSALASAASSRGNTEIVELLLAAGADVNQQLTAGKYGSALVTAVSEYRLEIMELLLKAGADVNQQLTAGNYGSALAAAAATYTIPWIIKLLLEAGADVNQQLTAGNYGSALAAAISQGNTEIVELLLESGADDRQLPSLDYKLSAPPSELQKITFSWELPSAINGLLDVEGFLLNTGTLTRQRDTVQLATSGEFLLGTYGTLGTSLLYAIIKALNTAQGIYVGDGMVVKTTRTRVTVTVSESANNVRHILQWICLTFRKPIPNTVCCSAFTRHVNEFHLNPLSPMPASTEDNECWRGLFKSAVVVAEPSLEYFRRSRGLELDFYTMLRLAAVEYPVLVDSGLVLMGYSTALVPIRLTEDNKILWHLEIASNDLQFKISDLHSTRQPWWQVEKLDLLSSKKAILGWCSEANVLLGTDQLTPKVAWSDARVQRTTWRWKGANLQVLAQSAAPVQIGGQIGMTFDRTANTLQFSPNQNYLKCLQSNTLEQIVLYDVSAGRAWLVPLLSVLHHMLLVYAETIQECSRVGSVPTVDPSSDGAQSSLRALKDNGATVVEASGGDKLTVRDLVMGFSVNLSKVSPQPPKRSIIYGYEFMDIVMDSSKSELKKKQINGNSSSWILILNDVNCLLCSGLGDAIVGKRSLSLLSPCNRLPKGFNLMAATMHCIKVLSTKHGGSMEGEVHMLTNKHCVFLTGDPFDKCEHEDSRSCCWNDPPFLQVIQTRQPSSRSVRQSFMPFADGALVFGGERSIRVFLKSPFRARQAERINVQAASIFVRHDDMAI